MIFRETKIKGMYLIEPERHTDERGFFARSFCKQEFLEFGLNVDIIQCNISNNKKKGTIRGMHYQIPPFEEVKIVSCTRGSIYDVVVDLRRDSPTFCQWVASELSDQNHMMVYIPKGCAHGFQTLIDDSVVYYQMMESFHPESARGIRWDDPSVQIIWPLPLEIISTKDRDYKEFK